MALMLQIRPSKYSLTSMESGVWSQRWCGCNNPWKRVGSSRLRMMAPRAFESSTVDAEQPVVREGNPGRRNRLSRLNTEINKRSKWGVAALGAGTVLWMHDNHSLWAMVGSMISGGLVMVLKYFINESRPSTAIEVKEDPGMPSSHSQGFAFLATYAALSLLLAQGVKVWTVLSASGIMLSVAYLSWLRVADGLHTSPQVLVGSAMGTTMATFWLWMWKSGVGAVVDAYPWAKIFLYVSSIVCSTMVYLVVFRNWKFGEF